MRYLCLRYREVFVFYSIRLNLAKRLGKSDFILPSKDVEVKAF